MELVEHVVEVADWHVECARLVAEGALMFDFLTAVDHPDLGRIDVVVHLVDVTARRRHLVRASLDRGEPAVGSLVDVCPGAAWHERETHEMFGVQFDGNPDLRPLLTTGDAGFPLRRTTPLPRRVATPWPGAVDPADRPAASRSGSGRVAARSRTRGAAPGVHPQWQP